MGKNKHRQASTPESKKQAAIWCAIAIIAMRKKLIYSSQPSFRKDFPTHDS